MTPLAENFVPGQYDVVCCRGNKARVHRGNVIFRNIIKDRLYDYSRAISKLGKSSIVKSIVDEIRKSSPKGGFVKEKNGRWYEVGDHLAREKVGQSLRDSLHFKYRSSSESKKRRRLEEQARIDLSLEDVVQSHYNEALDGICKIGIDPYNEDDVQSLLNSANCKLLCILKEKKINERVDETTKKTRFSSSEMQPLPPDVEAK